ncbi:MAG: ABC transporter permease [Spirochaetaceae bacterium]|jgi:spermidine/putrescine transport system permease protein|nr:ABC transporter permease [Spirochaetaceae bacterium]
MAGAYSETKKLISRPKNLGPVYSSPMTIWFTVFFLMPLLIILVYSFLKKDIFGGVTKEFSLNAYKALINPKIAVITLRTLFISLAAMILTIIVALPCGYYMARSRNQTFLLLLIIIPFWTNFLIRVFAWINILGNDGFINMFLLRTGIISAPVHLLFNMKAVVLVLIYMYLPYAILPLFSSIDKFDFSLLEAAQDLGATKLQAVFKVLLPNIKGGLWTAVLFTFIPMFGAYAVPTLVGDIESYMLGNAIADYLNRARDWPLASAISMVLTAVTTVGIIWILMIQRNEAKRRALSKSAKGI